MGAAIPFAVLIVGINYGVTGTADTDVVFTDVESGETYVIGYITSGAGGTIELERGKWYRVEGTGELTVRLVNVRIE